MEDAALLATTLAAKPVKPAKSPRVHRLKHGTVASTNSSLSGSAFGSGVLSSFDDSAVQSAPGARAPGPRDPSRSAPRRLAPVAPSQPLGSRRPANAIFSRLFDQPAQNFSNPARSLHALPMAREAEEGYIDIVPSDGMDLSRTFPRLKASTADNGKGDWKGDLSDLGCHLACAPSDPYACLPAEAAQANTYISALDARLELESLNDRSRPNSLLTRQDSDDNHDKEGQPTALALALQGAPQLPKLAAKSGSLSLRHPLNRTRQAAVFDVEANTATSLPARTLPAVRSPSTDPLPTIPAPRLAWANPHAATAPASPVLQRWQHRVDETSTSPLGFPTDPEAIPSPEPFATAFAQPAASTQPPANHPRPTSTGADAKRRLWTLQSRSQGSRDSATAIEPPFAAVRLRKTQSAQVSSQVSRANSVVVDEAAMSAAELAPPGSELELLEAPDARRSTLLHQWSMEVRAALASTLTLSACTSPPFALP